MQKLIFVFEANMEIDSHSLNIKVIITSDIVFWIVDPKYLVEMFTFLPHHLPCAEQQFGGSKRLDGQLLEYSPRL